MSIVEVVVCGGGGEVMTMVEVVMVPVMGVR